MKTFSANAIADLLERDRATIVRALRDTPPDGKERGQPRWKMTTALDALDQLPGSHNARTSPQRRANNRTDDGWRDPRITKAYDGVLEWYDELQAIDGLEQRRAAAKEKVGPLIAYNNEHLRDWNIENGHSEELAGHRAECLWKMSLNFARILCEWTDEEVYDELVIPHDDWPEDELQEHRQKRKEQRKKLLAKLIAEQTPNWRKEHAFDL
jgi:hypothetical protein